MIIFLTISIFQGEIDIIKKTIGPILESKEQSSKGKMKLFPLKKNDIIKKKRTRTNIGIPNDSHFLNKKVF